MCDACIPISWYHLIISPGNQMKNRELTVTSFFTLFISPLFVYLETIEKKPPFYSFISDLMLLSRKPVFIYFLNSWFFVGYTRWLVIMSCQSVSQQTRKLKLLTSVHSTLVAMQEKEFRQFSVYILAAPPCQRAVFRCSPISVAW